MVQCSCDGKTCTVINTGIPAAGGQRSAGSQVRRHLVGVLATGRALVRRSAVGLAVYLIELTCRLLDWLIAERPMPEEALPCIVCEQSLENAFSTSENQPSEATAFSTRGHYGSTFFDPMDGQTIEINICDECLSKRHRQGGFILWRRAFKEIECEGFIVGREWIDRPWVPYTGQDEASADDVLYIDLGDLGTDKFGERVEWIRSTCLEPIRESIKLMYAQRTPDRS